MNLSQFNSYTLKVNRNELPDINCLQLQTKKFEIFFQTKNSKIKISVNKIANKNSIVQIGFERSTGSF